MGTRRLGFALVAALIISTVISYFLYLVITRQQAAAKPQTRHVVAAATSLQPGTPLTVENLTDISWPADVPMDGLIEKKEDAVGRMLVYALDAKAPVLKHDLAPNGSFGLAAKIPDGMRATAVKTNEVSDVAGFIFPGAHVDVLITVRTDNNPTSTATRTVLQNVQVLATGTKTDPDPNGKPENVSVVTLLVTPEESEKLALAQNEAVQNQGTIHFVLRNGGDVATPETAPVDLAQLTGIPRPASQKALRRTGTAKALEPVTYSVETVSGGKVSVAKFPASKQ